MKRPTRPRAKLNPGPFAIAGHQWFPADWRKHFQPGDILRESPSGKSILVRMGQGVNTAAKNDPKDSQSVSIKINHGLETLFLRAE